ncbi:ShlB/FhaC/HecB family hemolysin secretion/activation protein [Actimicrobium sp. CCI2.3]|uniref:ShlB/FhaC/HecB family hemolysin secretion/activation protein n=1 Tax=Actimicrobium sp. CCI2.3 TaxID=3048616 RepID=UPI002AB440C1|nr:ShlB/FhaC/HecB family hemolysin secretion/activation protein [Actimicrobium sp. CCI2.3]MDY7572696.1 ShlB/FhaC/HecB family hemolysin secretion/activation protein [Actimicrobium sp. CCI2.3]MEB0022215.1 ShlB/FhaC/HecB family hemolysin secretion/activation protein [Actimicrobium sp. CCI2.3]
MIIFSTVYRLHHGIPLLGCVSLQLVCGVALAQSSLPVSVAQEGLRREEERSRVQQSRLAPTTDVLQPSRAVSFDTVLPSETPCFLIRDIVLSGESHRQFRWLLDSAQGYLNRCVGTVGLSKIASVLDAKLTEFGYATTTVTLPAQNLAEGTLQVRLHAGRVGVIRMVSAKDADKASAAAEPTESATDTAWGTWRNAFATSTGDVLNMRDLEQGVEQMQRLASQHVITELHPGQQPDTSTLLIRRQDATLRERLHGGANVDNADSTVLGKPHISGNLGLDNPLGLNDLLSLSVSSNIDGLSARHRSQNVARAYSIPWGYNTFSLTNSSSEFAQVVQGTTAQFLSSGSSRTLEAKWHRTLLRTSSSKTGAYASLQLRRATSYLDEVELVAQRQRTTNVETGVTFRRLLDNASVDLQAGYRHSMPRQFAPDDLNGATQGGPTLRPALWIASGRYRQSFQLGQQPVQFSAELRAQQTADATLATDQIAIGNRATVRGFDGDSVLLAESGYVTRNELARPVQWLAGVESQVYAGIDAGRVWGTSAASLIGDRLAGAVLGIRGKWQAAQSELSYGTPLYKPAGFRSANHNLTLSLTVAF